MDAAERYEVEVRKAARLRDEQQRRQGSVDQMLKQLNDDHGCKTVEKAEAKAAKLNKEAEALEARAEELLDEVVNGQG